MPIPWKAIWTSSAVWAIICAQFAEGWGFFTLQTELPTFLKDALNFDLTKSGFISAIPYLTMSIMLHIAGQMSDWVIIKGWLTTQQTRKYFNTMAFAAQMVCMLLAAFLLHPTTSVVFITIGVGLAAFAYSSFSVNYLDIAPNFAGLLMGICNSFSTVAGIVSPLLTGFIVQNKVIILKIFKCWTSCANNSINFSQPKNGKQFSTLPLQFTYLEEWFTGFGCKEQFNLGLYFLKSQQIFLNLLIMLNLFIKMKQWALKMNERFHKSWK